MKRKSIFREYIVRNRYAYLFGFFLLAISSVLQLVIPDQIGKFADLLEQNRLTGSGAAAIAGWIALAAAGIAFFRSSSRIYMFRLGRQLEMNVRGDLFRHWERMPAHYFNNRRIGDLMSHAINDVNVIREVTMQGIFNSLEAIVLIGVTVTAMVAATDPWLTLFTMLPLPFLTYLAYRFNKRIQRQSIEVQDAVSRLTSRVQEFVAGIRIVKAFVQEKAERERFDQDNAHSVNMNRRLVRSNSLFNSLSMGVVGLSFLVAVVFGGVLVLQDKISLGSFVAFNTYLLLLTTPIENLGRVANQVQRGWASEKRLLAILNEEPEIADGEQTDFSIDRIDGEIEIRGLTFRYPGANEPALTDIHLKVPKGSSLAIVGRVGSGKTTLVQLLVRLFDPPAGTVFIDGRDIREIPLQTLRSQVGIVPQDQFLFSTTIRENISFDPNPYTDEEVEEAAKIAQLYDNIIDFPHRFETMLGERGVSLSGGQRQRACIARAIIKKPSILIFDDSLSAVDTVTEERILQGLKKVMENRTTIIIGHRISSVQSADQIIVLDQGRLVERGTHEELLALGGLYAEMYEKQLLDEEESPRTHPSDGLAHHTDRDWAELQPVEAGKSARGGMTG